MECHLVNTRVQRTFQIKLLHKVQGGMHRSRRSNNELDRNKTFIPVMFETPTFFSDFCNLRQSSCMWVGPMSFIHTCSTANTSLPPGHQEQLKTPLFQGTIQLTTEFSLQEAFPGKSRPSQAPALRTGTADLFGDGVGCGREGEKLCEHNLCLKSSSALKTVPAELPTAQMKCYFLLFLLCQHHESPSTFQNRFRNHIIPAN